MEVVRTHLEMRDIGTLRRSRPPSEDVRLSEERLTPEDYRTVYKLVGEHSRDDANGVPQVCFIGVIDPLNPTVETPQQVADDLVTAANHIPKERLGATDDCGFSPFSVDDKPKHGSPDFARDIAFQKITARIQGVAIASEKLGL